MKNYPIRICVLGTVGSGKTSLCSRYVNNFMEPVYRKSDESARFRKVVQLNQGDEMITRMVVIDDVIGINHPFLTEDDDNEHIHFFNYVLENTRKKDIITHNKLYKERPANVYFFLFDLTDESSFDDLAEIIIYISSKEERDSSKKNFNPCLKYLVATKSDALFQEINNGFRDKIDKCKKKFKLEVVQVSAFSNENVEELFRDALLEAMDRDVRNFRLERESARRAGKEPGLWCNCRENNSSCQLI